MTSNYFESFLLTASGVNAPLELSGAVLELLLEEIVRVFFFLTSTGDSYSGFSDIFVQRILISSLFPENIL